MEALWNDGQTAVLPETDKYLANMEFMQRLNEQLTIELNKRI